MDNQVTGCIRLLEAALYVQDVALDSIDFYGIKSREEWDAWCDSNAQRVEEDADSLFVDNMDQDPVLLDAPV